MQFPINSDSPRRTPRGNSPVSVNRQPSASRKNVACPAEIHFPAEAPSGLPLGAGRSPLSHARARPRADGLADRKYPQVSGRVGFSISERAAGSIWLGPLTSPAAAGCRRRAQFALGRPAPRLLSAPFDGFPDGRVSGRSRERLCSQPQGGGAIFRLFSAAALLCV